MPDSSVQTGSARAPGDDGADVSTTERTLLLGELIAGLDEVGALPIPYARLPPRVHAAFSPHFASWSDIAGQTVESLLSYPVVGEAAVRALLAAAHGAVAGHRAAAAGRVGAATAVGRLLDQLDHLDRVLLSARVWAARPPSQRVMAKQLGMNPARIVRNQPRAEARFAELVGDPMHHEVREHAEELRRRLGSYVPEDVADATLRRLDVDPSGEAARVLLHLAGHYVERDGWLENTTTGGRHRAAGAVDALLTRCPAPSTAALTDALTDVGMAPGVVDAYLRTRVTLRQFGDVWVRWGRWAADKLEAVLQVLGVPSTPEDVFAAIGGVGPTLHAVHETLYADPRFVRATRQTWGLRTWGIDEYEGIAEEIGSRIDAEGGRMNVDELVADLLSSVPDVAERSIMRNLGTLAFVVEAGMVRRRTDTDEWRPIGPLHAVRGAFRNGDNEIRLAVSVTNDVLRGSGRSVRRAVATALGVGPGQRRTFTGPHGQLSLNWIPSSTGGPSFGSLQALARAVAAGPTDTLLLAFGLEDDSLDVMRIDANVTGMQRLRGLLGRSVRNPSAALAASLKCPRADVTAVLRRRGEDDLAELVGD